MTSSNQDIKTNVATLVCKEECEVHVLSFVVCFCLGLPWKRLCYGVAVLS